LLTGCISQRGSDWRQWPRLRLEQLLFGWCTEAVLSSHQKSGNGKKTMSRVDHRARGQANHVEVPSGGVSVCSRELGGGRSSVFKSRAARVSNFNVLIPWSRGDPALKVETWTPNRLPCILLTNCSCRIESKNPTVRPSSRMPAVLTNTPLTSQRPLQILKYTHW
jgi:hypothetical protein